MIERNTTPMIADVMFVRTPVGEAALAGTSAQPERLSAKARSLLQMLDGTRSSVQLLRHFKERELTAYLAVLEVTGHIQPLDHDAVRDLRACYSDAAPVPDDLRDLFAWADEPEPPRESAPADSDAAVAAGRQAGPTACISAGAHVDSPIEHLSALSAAAASSELGSLRERLLLKMLRQMGTAGEAFALRIVRCSDAAELRGLLPAIVQLIEVRQGGEKARQFARETQGR